MHPVQTVLITETSVLSVKPKHRYSKGAERPLGIESVAGWEGEMANGTRAGLPEQRWIIAQMQTCWKNLFNDLISLTIKCKMFPWHLSTHVKIPCKVANSPLETTCYLSRPGQEGSLHVNGVHSAVTYSCRRLFILAKASAWMERMALSPRFLHNTTKGSVNKRGAMPIAKALQI